MDGSNDDDLFCFRDNRSGILLLRKKRLENKSATSQAVNPCSSSALVAAAPDLEMEVEGDTDGEEEDDENEVFIDSDDEENTDQD